MRWDGLSDDTATAEPALFGTDAVTRTFVIGASRRASSLGGHCRPLGRV